tara:strand:+ start:929 stop:1591 length:663 start_codon:yes stop_codon:yes gene_type:complete
MFVRQTRMNFKIIKLLYENRKNTIFRNEGLLNLIIIGLRIKIGEIFGSIYVKQNLDNKHIEKIDLLHTAITEFDCIIRNTLKKYQLENEINFDKKGIKNLGSGLVYIPSAFKEKIAFTQKEAEFYFQINKHEQKNLNIELVSIPKISGKIKIDNEILDDFKIGSFQTKQIKIKINPNQIQNDVSKIRIIVDKCWNINHIYKLFPNFPLGVGIKSVKITRD